MNVTDLKTATMHESYPRNVEDAAALVLRRYWTQGMPVDPEAIAVAMGADIVGLDYSKPISGCLEIESDSVKIGVKRTDPKSRQRFTIAHEIGHWVLGHGPSFRDPVENYTSKAFGYSERQANNFAACLLMPKGDVLGMVSGSTRSIDEMAAAFQVSRSAMEYRLKNLGVIA